MTPLTAEWVDKAEGDFTTAQRELRARKNPNYDSACFHSQQCAEKYLKARLQEAGIVIPRTHYLPTLLNLILPEQPTWATLLPALTALSVYAVDYRYPGQLADRPDARSALIACRTVRETIRLSFGLPI